MEDEFARVSDSSSPMFQARRGTAGNPPAFSSPHDMGSAFVKESIDVGEIEVNPNRSLPPHGTSVAHAGESTRGEGGLGEAIFMDGNGAPLHYNGLVSAVSEILPYESVPLDVAGGNVGGADARGSGGTFLGTFALTDEQDSAAPESYLEGQSCSCVLECSGRPYNDARDAIKAKWDDESWFKYPPSSRGYYMLPGQFMKCRLRVEPGKMPQALWVVWMDFEGMGESPWDGKSSLPDQWKRSEPIIVRPTWRDGEAPPSKDALTKGHFESKREPCPSIVYFLISSSREGQFYVRGKWANRECGGLSFYVSKQAPADTVVLDEDSPQSTRPIPPEWEKPVLPSRPTAPLVGGPPKNIPELKLGRAWRAGKRSFPVGSGLRVGTNDYRHSRDVVFLADCWEKYPIDINVDDVFWCKYWLTDIDYFQHVRPDFTLIRREVSQLLKEAGLEGIPVAEGGKTRAGRPDVALDCEYFKYRMPQCMFRTFRRTLADRLTGAYHCPHAKDCPNIYLDIQYYSLECVRAEGYASYILRTKKSPYLDKPYWVVHPYVAVGVELIGLVSGFIHCKPRDWLQRPADW